MEPDITPNRDPQLVPIADRPRVRSTESVLSNRPQPQSANDAPMHDRMISGIDLIDYGAGGLAIDKPYLVKGGLGVGKTITGLQFVARGLELGEPAVYVTNQKPASILEQAARIGFHLEEAVTRGQLLILNTSDRYFDLVESPADVTAIVEELGDYIRETGARRLVIDPIYSLVTTAYSSHFAVTLTQSLMNAIEELPVTSLMIAGDEENPELAPIIRVAEQNSAGVLTLGIDRTTGARVMRLSKLRHGSNENLAASYRILEGRGIINYRDDGEVVDDVTRPWADSEEVRRSVLILGSNPETIRGVRDALGDSFTISAEPELHRGLERVCSEKPGLVLVTPSSSRRSLPALLELARTTTSSIAFLSPGSNRTTDKVLYLRAGADDFITEPFSPDELRARVDALVRRSGRRLIDRDATLGSIDEESIAALSTSDRRSSSRSSEVLTTDGKDVLFDTDFRERLDRNIDTVSKLDMNFALYWLKGNRQDAELNKTLARLCRQEDVLCRNANGEFVALLTGTDDNGVRGFEARLRDRLGEDFEQMPHGSSVYVPGEPLDEFRRRALQH